MAQENLKPERSPYKDPIIGFASGAVYGTTSLIVGHPLDTLKTKMQAQSIHLSGSSSKVFFATLAKEGPIGLYRGCIPPLLGASVLRSVQFGVFVSAMSFMNNETFKGHSLFGMDARIYAAGMASGAARALIECPLDVAKIRRQIGESWKLTGLYKGLTANMARNIPLLSSFFIFLEISKGYQIPFNLGESWRPLLTGSICSTMAWTLVWPFDVIKSQVQGSTGKESFFEKFLVHYKNHGIKGFFRGYGPGATRSLIANGLSMVAFAKTKDYLERNW